MKKITLLLILCSVYSYSFAQRDSSSVSTQKDTLNQIKLNSIVFLEIYAGYSAGVDGGLSLNYQYKKQLFSLRYSGSIELSTDPDKFTWLFPFIDRTELTTEVAALYGWRRITKGHSYSISAGVSQSHKTVEYADKTFGREVYNYTGIPLEFNIKWFNKIKRDRILGIFRVDKPTAFSGSIGFKLYGNISKFSTVGLGLTYGFGYHKVYE
ncbi:hypothetical protein [Pedobacter metabolipauper]|uniref:Outer membrane protein with beta-barrel domain n=1 Tax=Pedobacter metabolipauper TaxID=425513 RepID=A0A4V3D153_9SPHI|nr:hypothetical protein [Pedobacter metabolipauper]TDQ08914.1 hypothetical protein ATK78_3435 [Pedobacter metabolipauper]